VSVTAQRAAHETSVFESGVASPPAARERLMALDVFRGLTIAGMLLVNNPGTWSAVYDPLEHAPWHGWTPTDLIFPFFLFIVGVTTHLSVTARRARGDDDAALVRQIVRRGLVIVFLGLFLAAIPMSLDVGAYPAQLASLRIPGVLQRIGIVYIVAALLSLRTSARQQIIVIAILLLGYWLAMTVIPVPGRPAGTPPLAEPARTLSAYIDRLLLDGHLWQATRTWDPEGLLSTLPAVATAMLGVLTGRWLAVRAALSDRLAALFAVGSLIAVAGLVWNWWFPINKNIWTSSYVLFTGGVAALTLATCMWLIDGRRITWWTKPFVIFGMNPIAAYVGAQGMARLIYTTIKVPRGGGEVPLQRVIFEGGFASWLAPHDASLLFATSYVLVWLGVMWLLYRRGIFLKV
jgi:predicted acyltransferase